MIRKKILCLSLCAVLATGICFPVYADTESDLKESRQENKDALSTTNQQIDGVQDAQDTINTEISDLDSQLVNLISNIDILKTDMTTTEKDIKDTGVKLTSAENDRDSQYDDMKTRMKYIYENGGDTTWISYILQAKDLADLLNRADYTEQMQQYDRQMYEEFANTVDEISDIQDSLESKEADLQQEQQDLESQQADLNVKLSEKKATSADYDNALITLQAQADELTSTIQAQNEALKEVQAQKAAEKAAAEKAASDAAAAKAAQDKASVSAAAAAAVVSQAESSNNTAVASVDAGTNETANTDTETVTKTPDTDTKTEESKETETQTPSNGASSSSIGDAVVSYACQFIGNPYVWGGESLTNGCDCSGFVMQVFAHFGYDLPHSSGALAGVGVGVSYSEAQPGDIVCYSGHVGIYVGNDTIVNASNERDGIKYTSPASYRTIVAVRRVG